MTPRVATEDTENIQRKKGRKSSRRAQPTLSRECGVHNVAKNPNVFPRGSVLSVATLREGK